MESEEKLRRVAKIENTLARAPLMQHCHPFPLHPPTLPSL